MAEEKSLRYRVNRDVSVKGIVTPSATVEATGHTQAEFWAEHDAFMEEVKKRYPIATDV